MSDNPTSDEIDESDDEKLEQDADKAADAVRKELHLVTKTEPEREPFSAGVLRRRLCRFAVAKTKSTMLLTETARKELGINDSWEQIMNLVLEIFECLG